MNKLVLASNNAGKLREFQQMLAGCGFEVIPQSDFNIPDADETGLSFVENALIKARHAAKISGLPALADDSGLAVDALQGAPGIYSARYSGLNATDATNNQKLLTELASYSDDQRQAQFICALALVKHAKDPTPIICQGRWRGRILHEPRGANGFGYDPLFWVEEQSCSSAELEKQEKNRISHRGLALQALLAELQHN